MIPTLRGTLSHTCDLDGRSYTCFVEEYAAYPVFGEDVDPDRKEVIEHLGILAATYTGTDLIETKSMWSIIDLAPLDVEIDEKQENANALIVALQENGYDALASQLRAYNEWLRGQLLTVFSRLPRCVYQGDLNSQNLLSNNGHFAGLIDFNMSGTDVNINVFVNETNRFPEESEFDALSVSELLLRQDTEQAELLAAILQHYRPNAEEQFALPYYRRIVDLFQYPNVCAMIKWIREPERRIKCAELIAARIAEPFNREKTV